MKKQLSRVLLITAACAVACILFSCGGNAENADISTPTNETKTQDDTSVEEETQDEKKTAGESQSADESSTEEDALDEEQSQESRRNADDEVIQTQAIKMGTPASFGDEFTFEVNSVEWVKGEVHRDRGDGSSEYAVIEDGKAAILLHCTFENNMEIAYEANDIYAIATANGKYTYDGRGMGEAVPLDESEFLIWFEVPSNLKKKLETLDVDFGFREVYMNPQSNSRTLMIDKYITAFQCEIPKKAISK